MFPKAEILVELVTSSDHALLRMNLHETGARVYGHCGFRYEAQRELDKKCCEVKGENKNDILLLERRLVSLHGAEGMPAVVEIARLKQELQLLLDQEDLKWKQRVKTDWLKHGDRNTKFHHACANQRRKSNQILAIKNADSNLWETQENVGKIFVDYFMGLFTASREGEVDPCLAFIEKRVMDEMNEQLLKDFTMEVVCHALHQMAPFKASGPNGLVAVFFLQKNWVTVGEEVIMPHIISSTQSAFIPGRLIIDNVLAAYETLHTMHSRMWGKNEFMAIKLDMRKAYDRVEWRLLETVMLRMGFNSRWIHLIMMCVSTAQYAVLVNGSPKGKIYTSRGLRQSDPLSPYLFLLCAEVLSSMISQANLKGVLTRVPTSKKGP
ncbi:uncharacterized protein LOC132174292 [Corylus avellana]|uniref:uncharacterized protein LOC132174292 n=1 Tax=Corylus avellana TaxID=13451 RepID=UPI00286C337D|nr:uncharacterized protein LOC132174292 [Corylus avellana]